MKRLNLNLSTIGNYNNDAEVVDDINEGMTEDTIIVSAVPFSMNTVPYSEDPSQKIASLFFVVQTKSNKTYTLYTSYLLEDEMEEEVAEMVPFHYDSNFASFRICAEIFNNAFPAYVTDFNFRDDKDNGIYRYSIQAREVSEESKTVRFYMSSDVFCSIKYIDDYIFEADINNYELSMASISAREITPPSKVVIADKVDRIVAMAPMKDTTTCAIEFVLVEGENKYTILSTFNLGKKFNKKKFKGMTVEKLNTVYLRESDQYLQIFSEFCRFENIDKDYLVIKAKNKDNKNMIFMIDGTSRTEFESMIGEY